MDDIQGKVVLVTGGGKGHGRRIAETLSGLGAVLAINDINPDRAYAVVQHIQEAGGQAREYLADISKKFPVQAMINQIEEDWGALDIVIQHARVTPVEPLLEMDEWNWRRTIDVNLTGMFLVTQSAGRVMRATGKGGVIVNLVQEHRTPLGVAFGTTQRSVQAFTRIAAQEFAPFGIHVCWIGLPASIEDEGKTIQNILAVLSTQTTS